MCSVSRSDLKSGHTVLHSRRIVSGVQFQPYQDIGLPNGLFNRAREHMLEVPGYDRKIKLRRICNIIRNQCLQYDHFDKVITPQTKQASIRFSPAFTLNMFVCYNLVHCDRYSLHE